MAVTIATALIGALIFGAAAACGIVAAKALLPSLRRFDDAPPAVDVPPAALVAGAVVLGAVLGFRAAPIDQLIIVALVTICLAAIWYCDAQTGLIPDVFTLTPLGAIVVYGFVQHQPMVFVSAVVMFIPFAVMALVSRGRGMGWGDAKLAALGGALLGVSTATIAFVVASLFAAAIGWLKYRSRNAPIAMGPYLVAAIAASLPFNVS